ncbi:hypothetical protein GCM10009544_47180 [Streptomyces stramineus]|uniref:Uncharacterized protein n=1 Tax=Streptomyces stramineus TaxID=173861 RepID=A0ABN1AMJ7_9ACTN
MAFEAAPGSAFRALEAGTTAAEGSAGRAVHPEVSAEGAKHTAAGSALAPLNGAAHHPPPAGITAPP